MVPGFFDRKFDATEEEDQTAANEKHTLENGSLMVAAVVKQADSVTDKEIDDINGINSISFSKRSSTFEIGKEAEIDVFIIQNGSNSNFTLPKIPGLALNENQSLSQPAGLDEGTQKFDSRNFVIDSITTTCSKHVGNFNCNHVGGQLRSNRYSLHPVISLLVCCNKITSQSRVNGLSL